LSGHPAADKIAPTTGGSHMQCPLAAPPSQPIPSLSPLPARPEREHELPHGGGWHLSSYELKRGVTVVELELDDEALA
jgi:hypothetical protein